MTPYKSYISYGVAQRSEYGVNIEQINSVGLGTERVSCEEMLQDICKSPKVLLTPSCTASLEMAALALDISPGDEVILPSFTFATTASAFALRGAKLIFVDIRPDTLNIDENQIEQAITTRTKAVVVVHYAGVACELDCIKDICKRHKLALVEDNAQGILSSYKGHPLGSFGDFGCISFHHTKNIHAGGEGGALLVNNPSFIDMCEILQEKGTDRTKFLRGEVDKYTWRELSSSYVMSDVQAMVLEKQLQNAKDSTSLRLKKWNYYLNNLSSVALKNNLTLPNVPDYIEHNAHIFYVLTSSEKEKKELFSYLRNLNIGVTFHYVPLHSSPAGEKYGEFRGVDRYTSSVANTLIRLPLHNSLSKEAHDFIIDAILAFYD